MIGYPIRNQDKTLAVEIELVKSNPFVCMTNVIGMGSGFHYLDRQSVFFTTGIQKTWSDNNLLKSGLGDCSVQPCSYNRNERFT